MQQLNRPSSASGVYYPLDKGELDTELTQLLSNVMPHKHSDHVKAIVVPHSPYMYAGAVYASAYKTLASTKVDECFILAPSLYSKLEGIVSAQYRTWETPLGSLEQSHRTTRIITSDDDLSNEVFRFDDSKFYTEPSIEVQLPFLQKVVGEDCKFIPLIAGEGSFRQYAKAINKHLDTDDLLIVSAELSHGYPAEYAHEIDQQAIKALLNLEIDKIESEKFKSSSKQAFGTLVELATLNHWRPELLMYRNTSEVDNKTESTSGYLAMAFVA